jgi:phosphoenolpyruvate carboxykinase (ATP)
MLQFGLKSQSASLSDLGITDGIVYWNQSAEELEHIILTQGQAKVCQSGAIAVDTGEFTGRSPKDRFIVVDSVTETAVWWNNFNIKFTAKNFSRLYKKAIQ